MVDSINTFPLPDLTYLREMAVGDEAFFKEIINIFIEDAPIMLNAIKESAESGDHDQLRLITHKLIPQLTFVGILSAIPDVKEINKESKEMNDLTERIDRLTKLVNYSIENLKKMI